MPYFPLGDDVLQAIIKLQLKQIGDRVRENHKAAFTYDDRPGRRRSPAAARKSRAGARNVDHILTGTLLPEMAGEILSRTVEGPHVQVGAREHVARGEVRVQD